MELRKQDILRAVVREFTVTAVPVGSQALVSRHFFNLSSATVRNELSELADRGYRYFVDFLMDLQAVPAQVETFIQGELRTAPADPQALLERVATTVASVTQNAAIATLPHGPQARLKHVDLVSLEPTEVLVILLVEGNLIRQQVMTVSRPVEQGELSRLANKLNRELVGKDRDGLELRMKRLGRGLEKEIVTRLAQTLTLFEQGVETLVLHDGVRNLLRQPEFAEASRLHQVLEVLEETRHLATLLQELVGESEMQIVIGSENQATQLRSCTVVLTTYGPTRRIRGVLGVLGPTRMDYGQVVARLQAVARRASERMSEMYA
jgi:heat-inducible transcriptional repressor